ncbi:hypothetical protein [Streptomyces sp. NPDC058434]|uniref:hypothetical protein n=1 Tax=Streptomyces sp. NPDC058434 TaxID=3346498 RepID=UPI0036642B6E
MVRLLRNAALTGVGALLLAPLAGCGLVAPSRPVPDRPAAPRSAQPRALAGQAVPQALPVPRGDGSRVPEDFNGDGHRDLVLDDLVKAPGAGHDDDAGIGIVYGTGDGPAGASAAQGPVSPAVRQLLTPRANGAAVGGTLPSAFDAAAACDLDKDGFGDLVVATDPRTTAPDARPSRCSCSSAARPDSAAGRWSCGSPSRPGTATSGPTTPSAETSTATARRTSR